MRRTFSRDRRLKTQMALPFTSLNRIRKANKNSAERKKRHITTRKTSRIFLSKSRRGSEEQRMKDTKRSEKLIL